MKGAKQHNKRELMAIRRTIESVFSVLKYYGIENILARSVDGFQQTVEIIVLTYNISYILQRYGFSFFNQHHAQFYITCYYLVSLDPGHKSCHRQSSFAGSCRSIPGKAHWLKRSGCRSPGQLRLHHGWHSWSRYRCRPAKPQQSAIQFYTRQKTGLFHIA